MLDKHRHGWFHNALDQQQGGGSIELELWHGSDAAAEHTTCNFLVWTGPSSQLLRAYPGASAAERQLLTTGNGPDHVTSSLVSI
jgi:hypothetical protein